jgi:protein-S-isoprenylcysteine O-methyltransferase Ste14
MALKEEMHKSGNWLFRWRSYLPLFMVVIIILAVPYSQHQNFYSLPEHIWDIFCLLVSLTGLSIRIITIGYTPDGTSGTNTKRQVARVLNTTGMYSMVRHPLYLGNFIIWIGISMSLYIWWLSLIVMLIFWLYYERIIYAEEEFLSEKFGESFLEWADKTPAFIPNPIKWRCAYRSFSLKRTLKNEYKSFYAIIISFVFVKIVGNIYTHYQITLGGIWPIVLTAGSIFYIIVRMVKKKTNILDVNG